MEQNPFGIDPDAVREPIVKGLVIDRKSGSISADYIETSNDPEIAQRELKSLAALLV